MKASDLKSGNSFISAYVRQEGVKPNILIRKYKTIKRGSHRSVTFVAPQLNAGEFYGWYGMWGRTGVPTDVQRELRVVVIDLLPEGRLVINPTFQSLKFTAPLSQKEYYRDTHYYLKFSAKDNALVKFLDQNIPVYNGNGDRTCPGADVMQMDIEILKQITPRLLDTEVTTFMGHFIASLEHMHQQRRMNV